MKKIISIALLYLSCSSKPSSNLYFELHVVKKIAQLSSIQPPPAFVSFTPVYVIGANDSVSESSFLKLQDVYNALYKNEYVAFYDFLYDALNQKTKIDTKNPKTYLYYSQTFLIDPNMTRLYKEKGIKRLMDKYCLNSNDFYTLNSGTLTLNEINSISYYFFLNQYIRADDDYEATINFKKLTSVLIYMSLVTTAAVVLKRIFNYELHLPYLVRINLSPFNFLFSINKNYSNFNGASYRMSNHFLESSL